MSLRVGYVNVQGLDRTSWEASCELLQTHFEYLFLAETWFVNHVRYQKDRRVIAWTPEGSSASPGRQHGGIYLLGSQSARSEVRRWIATQHSITVVTPRHTITAVYFPPKTISTPALTTALHSLRRSTIILGDINTRFRNRQWQNGAPGPADRLEAFVSFQTTFGFHHMMPVTTGQKLTTDHCFVRGGERPQLKLLAVGNFKTDHKYILSLALGQLSPTNARLLRFRLQRLTNPAILASLKQQIQRARCPFAPTDKIEVMDAKLTAFCQQIQQDVLGRQLSRPSTAQPAGQSSTRLYKQASEASSENSVILPTPEAQRNNIDALSENLTLYRERWAGQPFQPSPNQGREKVVPWLMAELAAEIKSQEADKSCGADGIHIQFLKAVDDTQVLRWLLDLYNHCRDRHQTPPRWNESDIYLLTKDCTKRRDAHNLRPISLICVFRKLFERLVLREFEAQPWAQLHPGQAGFRRSYSTLSNVAVVHALLASKQRSIALFLDLKSAFDVVDHTRLDAKLEHRRCPPVLRSLIHSLMCSGLRSRLLVNDQATEWFARTCGVLQGSPLSPWLFNLFIDDLLQELNTTANGIPWCLFYADDGVLLLDSEADLIRLVQVLEDWTIRNKILLNPKKCAILSTSTLQPIRVYQQLIPRQESYQYLGFPITLQGVDFAVHLRNRIEAAINKSHWLGVYSDAWGPAHRIQVFKTFLAPMFEYGAPLVWAWAQEFPQDFVRATAGFQHLMIWITNSKTTPKSPMADANTSNRWKITTNLCGLLLPLQRFSQLHTKYLCLIGEMDEKCPLRQLLALPGIPFVQHMQTQPLYAQFLSTRNYEPTKSQALSRFLRVYHTVQIALNSKEAHMTSLVPMATRQRSGLTSADLVFTAPVAVQALMMQYRRGVLWHQQSCVCASTTRFRRGHEERCPCFKKLLSLSRREIMEKRQMRYALQLQNKKFTTIDFLLNIRKLRRAGEILVEVQTQLRLKYSKTQAKEFGNA